MKVIFKIENWYSNSYLSPLEIVKVISKYFKVKEVTYTGESNSYNHYSIICELNSIPSNSKEIEKKIRKRLNCSKFYCFKVSLTEKESNKLKVIEEIVDETL